VDRGKRNSPRIAGFLALMSQNTLPQSVSSSERLQGKHAWNALRRNYKNEGGGGTITIIMKRVVLRFLSASR
jgi:hypothetical protein